MSFPNWTPLQRGVGRQHPIYGWQLAQAKPCRSVPGNVFLEMASGDRDHPGSIHLGLSMGRADAEHLMACIDEVFGVKPEYVDDPLHKVLECVG